MKSDKQKEIFTAGRRNFIRKTIHFVAGIGLLFGPLMTAIQNVWARTKRIILPRDTQMSSLVNRNPATLDTRHLEVIPLEKFETMGLTDHQVNLDQWRLDISGAVQKPLKLTYSLFGNGQFKQFHDRNALPTSVISKNPRTNQEDIFFDGRQFKKLGIG